MRKRIIRMLAAGVAVGILVNASVVSYAEDTESGEKGITQSTEGGCEESVDSEVSDIDKDMAFCDGEIEIESDVESQGM